MNGLARLSAGLALLLCGALSVGHAQSSSELGEAMRLERRGVTSEAAVLYRRVLDRDPTHAPALLGLERVLRALGTLDSIVPYLDAAIAVDRQSRFVREVQLRVYAELGPPERVAAAATQWMQVVPDSPDPFRQWAFVTAQSGHIAEALAILRRGRVQLGSPAFAAEMAQLYMASADWRGAAREWRVAVLADAATVPGAVAGLSQAPAWAQDDVLQDVLGRTSDDRVSRLGAELLVVWGRGMEGWTLLEASLPRERNAAVGVLRQFAERARRGQTRESARARGLALERLAALTSGEESRQARLDAAQAFADAGEVRAARRALDGLDVRPERGRSDAAALATLIRVSAESGRLDEAERRFHEWRSRLLADDVVALRETIARGWVLRGDLDRAERLLQADSTVNTLALLGWIAAYRGDLAGALDRFRAAGPYAQSREAATRRTSTLALLQRIEVDSLPALGAALLWLARADTARAIDELERAAGQLTLGGGRADVLAMGGDLAVTAGDFERGERLLVAALEADVAGPAAPGAAYALATAYAALGRRDEAVSTLEHLILTFPESAFVPRARRLLDQVQGLIPQSRSGATT